MIYPGRAPKSRRLQCVAIAVIGLLLAPYAMRAQTSAPAPAPAPTTRVYGVVFDSLAMRPLTGALVQLVVTTDPSQVRTVTADERGAFAFDDIPKGAYLLGFFHPRLDSLALDTPLLRVDVRAPGALRASLGIPSSSTMVARNCGPNAAKDSLGLFQGRVRQASGGLLAGVGRVRVRWSEIVVGIRGIERKTPSMVVTAGNEGVFAVCGIPAGFTITVRAWAGADSSGNVEFEVPIAGYLHRDVFVSTSTRVAATDSLPSLTVLRGAGMLRGTVRNLRGEPISGVRIGVWSSGIEVATNASGQYAMSALPTGTYTLETRAIGFRITRRAVDIFTGGEGAVDVTLEPLALLDTVKVKAARVFTSPALAEFEGRRKSGFGYFLDQEAIDKRQAITMADVFRIAPGVTVSPGQAFGDQILMRGTGARTYCIPALFLNGNRVLNDDGSLDQLVNPREVRAVEIYARIANVPAQFQTLGGCGALVVWTGARR